MGPLGFLDHLMIKKTGDHLLLLFLHMQGLQGQKSCPPEDSLGAHMFGLLALLSGNLHHSRPHLRLQNWDHSTQNQMSSAPVTTT